MSVPELEQKKSRCRIAENKKLAVSDCRKTKKMRLVDNRKKVFFFCSLFFCFPLSYFLFFSYSLFLGERRKKRQKE